MRHCPRTPHGLTLLETVVAITIGLVVLGGVGAMVYNSNRAGERQEAVAGATALIEAVRNLFAGQATSANISATTVAQSGAAPKSMVSGSSLVSPWHGTITLTPLTPLGYLIVWASTPTDTCMYMLMHLPPGVAEAWATGTHRASYTLSQARSACGTTGSASVTYSVASKNG